MLYELIRKKYWHILNEVNWKFIILFNAVKNEEVCFVLENIYAEGLFRTKGYFCTVGQFQNKNKKIY